MDAGAAGRARGLAQAFASLPLAIFVGGVSSPPAVVLAASPDTRVDAAGVLKGLLASVGGGGVVRGPWRRGCYRDVPS